MTLDEIEARLHEAITTLAALPDREQRWLRSKLASWPETLREAADVMGIAFERVKQGKAAYEAMTARKAVPSPDAIDRMDVTIGWLTWLTERQRLIVALRASGMSFDRIAWRFDRRGGNGYVSGETVRRWNRAALSVIEQKLREAGSAGRAPLPAA